MRIPGPALLLPLFLAGCALPPAVTIASLVADGVSYVTTGKGTADHAISAFANEDCALHRGVAGREICDPDGDVLVALSRGDPADENWRFDPETGVGGADATARWGSAGDLEAAGAAAPVQYAAAALALTPAPVGQPVSNTRDPIEALQAIVTAGGRGEFAAARPHAKPSDVPPSSRAPEPSAAATRRGEQAVTFAAIGSFRQLTNARRLVDVHGDDAVIQTVVVDGTTTYRVLLDRPVEQARHAGFDDAWPVRLCVGELAAPPCGHYVVSQAGVYIASNAN